jgi:hypothetical protein
MNREFLNKMKEAKKLESEAFLSFLPENVRGHMNVIENEMKAIFLECITECTMGSNGQGKDSGTDKSKIHKVGIM